MDQTQSLGIAKKLNGTGTVIIYLALTMFFICIFLLIGSLQAGQRIGLVVVISLSLWVLGFLLKGLAAIIFNQVKNNELIAVLIESKKN